MCEVVSTTLQSSGSTRPPRRSKGLTANNNGIANAIFAGLAIGYSPPIFFLVIGCSHIGLSFFPQNKNQYFRFTDLHAFKPSFRGFANACHLEENML
jgi:hypothetical protein